MNNTTDIFFSFMLSGTAYAVPVTTVKEVLPYEQVTPVPRTPDYLKGVVNIRGTVISVIDFRVLFGLPISEVGKETSIIVSEICNPGEPAFVFGFIADSVNEVGSLEKEPAGSGSNMQFVQMIGKNNNQMVLVLDLNKILSHIEEEIN
jgi:purine-binding chemotaxis protein CheW